MRVLVENWVIETSEVLIAKYGSTPRKVEITFKNGSVLSILLSSEANANLMMNVIAEKRFETR